MTKEFMARKGGWDNHVTQVQAGATTTGTHADLLKDVGDSVKAFQDDLQALGIADRVTTVVFSEFARKITQNGNTGTDHGTLSSMFVVGSQVTPGVFGDNINLSDKDAQDAANPDQLEHDYRSVYSSILQDWMGADDVALQASFPNTPSSVVLQNIPLIDTSASVSNTCYFEPTPAATALVNVKLFLEGFLLPDGTMNTELADLLLLPDAQPYGATRYSYFGEERANNLPTDAVDWVLLELWNTRNLVVGRQAVLLRKDGYLMDAQGNTDIEFNGLFPEETRLVVFHRSHLGVAVKATIDPNNTGVQLFDLTTAADSVLGEKQLIRTKGKYALMAGDVDQNGLINSADYSLWKQSSQMTGSEYKSTDLDANGLTNDGDFQLWDRNRSRLGYPEVHRLLQPK
jgi:hypothetical protein